MGPPDNQELPKNPDNMLKILQMLEGLLVRHLLMALPQ